MTTNQNEDPGTRVQKILYSSEEDLAETQLTRSSSRPLATQPPGTLATETTQTTTAQDVSEAAPTKRILAFGPAFWTITGCLSLIVNAVLITVLLSIFPFVGVFGPTAQNMGVDLVGGLYNNFEELDNAVIDKIIPVDANIPLDIVVPVETTTQIVLAEKVDIPNATVQITTGGVAINSNAHVTLPAGTPLMVKLDFDLPVKKDIPVHLDVPVNIPMADTGLHKPFVGLQEVIRPLYCFLNKNATNLKGQSLCP
jgi:hypothetical protein